MLVKRQRTNERIGTRPAISSTKSGDYDTKKYLNAKKERLHVLVAKRIQAQ